MRRLLMAALITVGFLAPRTSQSAEFFIELDTLAGHTPGTGATLGAASLKPLGWRSIGDPDGGRFINKTGIAIKAMHIKTRNAANTFKVTAASGGRLFATVWVKNDGSEAYFLDGNVPNLRAFWMRVPANTMAEIRKCDREHDCPFEGQVYDANPPEPTGGDWTEVKSALDGITGTWHDLITACPSEWREIQVYGEAPHGEHILFISDGQLLLFDQKAGLVSVLSDQDTIFSTVNRITYEEGDFRLLRNGSTVRTVGVTKEVFETIGRSSRAKAKKD